VRSREERSINSRRLRRMGEKKKRMYVFHDHARGEKKEHKNNVAKKKKKREEFSVGGTEREGGGEG